MRLLSRPKESDEQAQVETLECVHGVRIPHWDNLDDMGHEDRVTHYTCESCGAQFTPAEDAALHPTDVLSSVESERL